MSVLSGFSAVERRAAGSDFHPSEHYDPRYADNYGKSYSQVTTEWSPGLRKAVPHKLRPPMLRRVIIRPPPEEDRTIRDLRWDSATESFKGRIWHPDRGEVDPATGQASGEWGRDRRLKHRYWVPYVRADPERPHPVTDWQAMYHLMRARWYLPKEMTSTRRPIPRNAPKPAPAKKPDPPPAPWWAGFFRGWEGFGGMPPTTTTAMPPTTVMPCGCHYCRSKSMRRRDRVTAGKLTTPARSCCI